MDKKIKIQLYGIHKRYITDRKNNYFEINRMEKIEQANSIHMRAGVAILLSDKIDF